MSIQILVRGVSVDHEFTTVNQLKAMAADPANRFKILPPLPRTVGAMVEQSESRLASLNWPKSTPLVVAYVCPDPMDEPQPGEMILPVEKFTEDLHFKFLAGVERPLTIGDQGCHLVAIVGRDQALVERVTLELSASITNQRAEAVLKG